MERWLYSTNCKDIAILYMIFAIFAGLIGTGLSIIIRLELAGPNPQILHNNGQLFNSIVSLHAVAMVFFLVMPMTVGFFGNYLVPQMIGAVDMSLSRLNNISFWLLVPSLLLGVSSALIESGPGTGNKQPLEFEKIHRKPHSMQRHSRWLFYIKSYRYFIYIWENLYVTIIKYIEQYAWYIILNIYHQRLSVNSKFTNKNKYQNNDNDTEINKVCDLSVNLNVRDPKDDSFKKWLVGFTDGDGTFIIYKTRNTYSLAYKLGQNKYNKRILYYIKKNIGVGSVHEEKNTKMAQYSVYSREKIGKYILPIFDKYPLLTSKYYDYEKFKKVYYILEDINLSIIEKNKLIEDIIELKINDNYISPVWYNNINNTNIISKEWLIGFIEAEGSFIITKNGKNYVHKFSICQKRDKHLLKTIKLILNINTKIYYNNSDKCNYLETKSKKSIEKIIDYVENNLKGVKSLEFKLWKRAFINNYNSNKKEKIQLIIRKIRNKLS